jgi:hypothetical protein
MNGRRDATFAAVLVVVVTVAICLAWPRWHGSRLRPPVGPEALATTASLELTTYEAAQTALGEEVNAPLPGPDGQLVLGRVSWQPPQQGLAGGLIWILLIDKRTDLKPPFFSVASPRQESVGCAADGVFIEVANRYPWLRGAADRRDSNGFHSTGMAVYAAAADATPVTFVAVFPAFDDTVPAVDQVASAPVAVSDLLLAMVYVGADRQIYWATRLAG